MAVNKVTVTRDKIKKTKTGDGKWRITVEVCNGYSVEKTVEVHENPWMEPDHIKLYASYEVPKQTITIPANSCKEVTWDYDKEPMTSYSDVGFPGDWPGYQDGAAVDFPKKKASIQDSSGSYLILPIRTPYPWRMRLKDGPGQSATYRIVSIDGVPIGWSVEVLYPGLNAPFVRTDPDRDSEGVLRIVRPMTTVEGEVVVLDVVQRVDGQPDEPIYRFDSRYCLVADTTAPTVTSVQVTPNMAAKLISLTVVASDSVSDVREVLVRFSTDAGVHWAYVTLVAPQSQVFSVSRDYSGTLGPFCGGQTVRLEVIATDQMLNSQVVPAGQVVF